VRSFRLASPHDADAVIAQFVAAPGPALLHAHCHPTENVWPMIPAGQTIDEMMDGKAEATA
jgi:thiamine pyrophosphate-dependent acetolactate synthase large subunit-like protein